MQNSLQHLVKTAFRWLWTAITYLVLVLVVLFLALPFGLWGLWKALAEGRSIWFGLRSGLMMGIFQLAKWVVGSSSKVYAQVFLRPHHPQALPLGPKKDLLIIGHRGDPWNAPENTIEAFDRALRNGANALEIDLCLTKDGQVVVWHDWDPETAVARFRASGQEQSQGYRPFFPENEFLKPVPALSLAELRQHYGFARNKWTPFPSGKTKANIPSFDEFLDWACKQKSLKTVFLDIKVPEEAPEKMAELVPKMVEALKARKVDFEPVLMTPFTSLFETMQQHSAGYPCCLDCEVVAAVFSGTEEEAASFGTVQHALALGNTFASIGRPTFLSLAPWEIYTNILRHDLQLRESKAPHIKLIAWTIDDTQELQALVQMGIDGILTNRPARLSRKILKNQTLEALKPFPKTQFPQIQP